jgi:hypothetical protein
VPTISVWTGNSWKPVDFLGALSTATFATQAVPLKLPRAPADTLRVWIDGLPGTWRMDSAEVGFNSASPAQVRELLPVSARTREGRDVLKPLERIDRERHVLENGDAVELTFAAPPSARG